MSISTAIRGGGEATVARVLFGALDPETARPLFSDKKCDPVRKNPELFKICQQLADEIKDDTSKFMDVVHYCYFRNGEEEQLRKTPPQEFIKIAQAKMRAKELEVQTDVTAKQRGKIDEDGLFKCSKCHSTRMLYVQTQDRGKDEPPTTRVWCANKQDDDKPREQQCPRRYECFIA